MKCSYSIISIQHNKSVQNISSFLFERRISKHSLLVKRKIIVVKEREKEKRRKMKERKQKIGERDREREWEGKAERETGEK